MYNGCSQTMKSKIAAWYSQRLVPLAAKGLSRMFVPSKSAYCTKAVLDDDGQVLLHGVSLRYTAMVLIGLGMQKKLGNSIKRRNLG